MSKDFPSELHLKVIASHRVLADEIVQEVSLPSVDGELGILPGHRPLIAALGEGVVSFLKAKNREAFSVRGGCAEIGPENVLVFTELFEDEKG